MSEIIKTEAVVLSKLNYGDTSSIVNLYTESDGKLSVILKGGRNPKSKIGKIVDPLNHIQVIIYKKSTRDIQILSSADLISYFPNIKNDLDSTKYAFAIIELINYLTLEGEHNKKLFKGVVKVLNLIEQQSEHSSILFGRFFIFFLSELGYELEIDKCGICGKEMKLNSVVGYNLEIGFACSDCYKSHSALEGNSAELFNYIFCLKFNKKIVEFDQKIMEELILFLERYLKFHVQDFRGIKSLQIYR